MKELYEILNLAEKFQVKELKDRVGDFIKNFPLSIDNVVEVTATVEEFSHFKSTSRALYSRCAAIIQMKLTNVQSMLNFVERNADKVTVMKLLKISKVPCSTCQQKPCLNISNRTYISNWAYVSKISNVSAEDLIVPGMMVENDVIVVGGVTGAFRMGRCRVVRKFGQTVVLTPVDSVYAPMSDLYIIYGQFSKL